MNVIGITVMLAEISRRGWDRGQSGYIVVEVKQLVVSKLWLRASGAGPVKPVELRFIPFGS
jgi:hypothetical protein